MFYVSISDDVYHKMYKYIHGIQKYLIVLFIKIKSISTYPWGKFVGYKLNVPIRAYMGTLLKNNQKKLDHRYPIFFKFRPIELYVRISVEEKNLIK